MKKSLAKYLFNVLSRPKRSKVLAKYIQKPKKILKLFGHERIEKPFQKCVDKLTTG